MINNKRRKKPAIPEHFDMSISDIGEELEGVILKPDVIVHAENRATLITKANAS